MGGKSRHANDAKRHNTVFDELQPREDFPKLSVGFVFHRDKPVRSCHILPQLQWLNCAFGATSAALNRPLSAIKENPNDHAANLI